MAFMHENIYESYIKPAFATENATFSEAVNIYRTSNVSLAELGITSLPPGVTFNSAIESLAELSGGESARKELWEKMPPSSYKKLVQLISSTTDSASTVIALLESRPPLDCAFLLRKVIDEIFGAIEQSQPGDSRTSLATDDIIPLLAWTMIKAGSQDLVSLLFYTRTFRLTPSSAADVE